MVTAESMLSKRPVFRITVALFFMYQTSYPSEKYFLKTCYGNLIFHCFFILKHLSSQRHKNMLEGKPPKPRWSPYERTQATLLHPASAMVSWLG